MSGSISDNYIDLCLEDDGQASNGGFDTDATEEAVADASLPTTSGVATVASSSAGNDGRVCSEGASSGAEFDASAGAADVERSGGKTVDFNGEKFDHGVSVDAAVAGCENAVDESETQSNHHFVKNRWHHKCELLRSKLNSDDFGEDGEDADPIELMEKLFEDFCGYWRQWCAAQPSGLIGAGMICQFLPSNGRVCCDDTVGPGRV